MAEILLIDISPSFLSPRYVTFAGTITDSDSNPVARKVSIFNGDMYASVVATTTSSVVTGEFTTQTYGTANSEFTVIIEGEGTENSVIYSNVKE